MKAALHLTVRGRVQGVGYRYYAQRSAAALGLTGFVRNRIDGSVELLAEGDPDKLDQLTTLLKEGPSFAFVEGVDSQKMPYKGSYTHFSIKY
jgi:acylphosphatase